MDRKLYIQPASGLCNRWRAILSAIGLAAVQNRELVICWNRQSWCNTDFRQLWQLPRGVRLAGTHSFNHVRGRSYGIKGQSLRGREAEADRFRVVRVLANYSFANKHWPADPLAALPPNAARVRDAERFYDEHFRGNKVVSACVRWNVSHPKSRQTRPSWFEAQMRRILHDEPDCKFFMVVDNVEMRDRFRRLLGDAMLEAPKTTYKNGTARVSHQSMVDTLLMCRSSFVMGSWHSSFTRMPQMLGGARLVTHKTRPEQFPAIRVCQ